MARFALEIKACQHCSFSYKPDSLATQQRWERKADEAGKPFFCHFPGASSSHHWLQREHRHPIPPPPPASRCDPALLCSSPAVQVLPPTSSTQDNDTSDHIRTKHPHSHPVSETFPTTNAGISARVSQHQAEARPSCVPPHYRAHSAA